MKEGTYTNNKRDCAIYLRNVSIAGHGLERRLAYRSLFELPWSLRARMLAISKLCQDSQDSFLCVGLGIVAMYPVFAREGNTLRILCYFVPVCLVPQLHNS